MNYDGVLDLFTPVKHKPIVIDKGGGTFLHLLPDSHNQDDPSELPVTALTDIQIALMTSTKATAATSAAGLKAIGQFLTNITVEDEVIQFSAESVDALVDALESLRGEV